MIVIQSAVILVVEWAHRWVDGTLTVASGKTSMNKDLSHVEPIVDTHERGTWPQPQEPQQRLGKRCLVYGIAEIMLRIFAVYRQTWHLKISDTCPSKVLEIEYIAMRVPSESIDSYRSATEVSISTVTEEWIDEAEGNRREAGISINDLTSIEVSDRGRRSGDFGCGERAHSCEPTAHPVAYHRCIICRSGAELMVARKSTTAFARLWFA